MKPFKDQGWLYYNKCKTIMYSSKARGGRAFFAGVGDAATLVASCSSNISMGPIASTSSSDDRAAASDVFVNSFGEMHTMTNVITSLHAAQSRVKLKPFPLFGVSHLTGDEGELLSISSSSYGVKRSHDSMTTTSGPLSQSLLSQSHSSQSPSFQPLPSSQLGTSTSPSSHPDIPANPLPPASPPKKRSKGTKISDNVVAPPSRAQKEKVTAAVVVNGMQGTIDRMTDMLANVLDPNTLAAAFVTASASASTSPTPAVIGSSASLSDKCVLLQHLKNDNGLTHSEKARLLNIFMKNPGAVEMYLELLDDDELCHGYAHELLKDV